MSPRTDGSAALAIALIAGVCGAIQPEVNAALADRAGSVILASLVNFTVAFSVVVVVVASRSQTRRTLGRLTAWPVPWWTLTAGLGGAFLATTAAFAVARIGVAIFSVAFFAGQIAFGLAVDRLGVGPGGRRPIAGERLGAACVAVAAVAVSQVGRPVGRFAPAVVVLVVSSGAALAFQSAFNGRIAAATGDAFAATAVNVVVGLVALVALVAGLVGAGAIRVPSWPSDAWLYTGGLLGVTIVFAMAYATRALGVLRATLGLLAAQLVAAFAVDWVVDDVVPTPGVVAGAFLIVVAVLLVRPRTRAPADHPTRTTNRVAPDEGS